MKNIKTTHRFSAHLQHIGISLLVIILGFSPLSLEAQRVLRVYNMTGKHQDIKLVAGNCYDDIPWTTPNGNVFENVPNGGFIDINYSRKMGHGCDGKQGNLGLEFSPGLSEHKKIQWFNFNSDEVLAMSNNANKIGGNLAWISNGSYYSYMTPIVAPISAGEKIGEWVRVCSGVCQITESSSVTNATTNSSTISKETVRALEVAVEGGVEFDGVSGKTTVTSTQSRSLKSTISKSVTQSNTNTKQESVIFTPQDMANYNIQEVYQWQMKMNMSNGEVIIIKTNMYTCTTGGSPTYNAGDPAGRRACSGGLIGQD